VDPESSLSVAEVAHRVGVNPETVRLWIVEGKLAAFRKSPRPRARWRVRTEDLEAMLQKRDTESPSEPRAAARAPARYRPESDEPALEMLSSTDLVDEETAPQ
jgi:excisionase family DNA binding protein